MEKLLNSDYSKKEEPLQSGNPSPVHSKSPKKKSNTKTVKSKMANASMFK